MASVVKIKRSSVQGKQPDSSQLQLGELALNTRDGKLFSSTGSEIFEVGANTSVASIGTLTVGNTSPFTLPISDGANGQVLKTDGSGSVYWADDNAEVSNNVSSSSNTVTISRRDSSFTEFNFTANTGQTLFSGTDNSNNTLIYDSDKIVVFLNGVRLSKDIDYFANNSSTIVLDDPVSNNDVVDVHTHLDVENELFRSQNSYTANVCYTQSIDSWSLSEYRSAKYIVQIEDVGGDQYEVREVLLVHNGNRAHFTECGVVNTNGSRVVYVGTRVANGRVNLLLTPAMGQSIDVNLVRISLE